MDIYTSIPPVRSRATAYRDGKALDYIAECLNSWRNNGFSVHTINRQDELDRVREMTALEAKVFPETHGSFFPGRYGPPFGAIFDAVAPGKVSAIINADIYMILTSDASDKLRNLAEENFVFARRTEIYGLNGCMHKIYECGIDFVAFSVDSIRDVISDHDIRCWQLGVCWWDYVLPIAASFFVPIKRIREPFIFHSHHEHKLYAAEYAHMRVAAWQTLKRLSALQAERSPVAAEFKTRLESLETLTMGSMSTWEEGFANLCCEWLFGRSGPAEEVELPIDPGDRLFRNLLYATLSGHRGLEAEESLDAIAQTDTAAPVAAGGAVAQADTAAPVGGWDAVDSGEGGRIAGRGQAARKRKVKDWVKLWKLKRRSRGQLTALRMSKFFEPYWYLYNYPDVAAAKIDPALHYLAYGYKEKRDPGPHFSTERYLLDYPDVAASGVNPLVHYVVHGRIEGRNVRETSLTAKQRVW